MATPELPAPSAQGTLAKTPAVHLFVYVYERELSGTLVLSTPDGDTTTIALTQGWPSRVKLEPADVFLSTVLEDQGFAEEHRLAATYQLAQRQRRRHGEVLVEHGDITEEQLQQALRVQLERKAGRVFFMSEATTFAYYAGVDLLADYGGPDAPLDPLALVWNGVRQRPPWDHVNAALNRLASASMRLAVHAAPERFAFRAAEMAVVQGLGERPARLADLIGSRTLGPSAMQTLVYCLLITKQVDLTEGAMPAGATPGPPSVRPAPPSMRPSPSASPPSVRPAPAAARMSAPPSGPASMPPGSVRGGSMAPGSVRGGSMAPGSVRSMPPAPESSPPSSRGGSLSPGEELWMKEILARAKSILTEDYFQMLGIERSADASAVDRAYLTLAKKWHPDRVPLKLERVKGECTRVFAHISEAHQTLMDPKRREQYVAVLKDGGGTPEAQKQVQSALEAITHFQKAEVFFKIRDYAQAEAFARKALAADPGQSEYIAFVAWIEAMKPENQPVEPTRRFIDTLGEAIKANPNSERAYFYRGMLNKRIDQHAAAIKDFKRVADLNPNHVDAAREVRLHYMRSGPSSPPKDASLGGLIGKFFKK